MTEATCERCGEVFAARSGGLGGNPKRYCSEKCRGRAERARRQARQQAEERARKVADRVVRPCLGCGATVGLDWWVGRMKHPGAAASRCHPCYLAYQRERYHENPDRRSGSLARNRARYQVVGSAGWNKQAPEVACRDCGEMFKRHAGQRERCSPCSLVHYAKVRSASEARRRAVMVAGDKDISWRTLGERDRWCCHLCGSAVLRVAGVAKQPRGATVDHLLPIAAGGLHLWSNVALAHRQCNIERGAGGIVQLRIA